MYLFNANLINKVHYNEDGLINAKLISNRAENYIYNGIKIVQTPYVNIEYDDHNQITKVEDAYGIVRSFTYTKNKDLQSEKLTYLNHTKKINYEYKNHQVTKVKNSAETCYHENTYSFDTSLYKSQWIGSNAKECRTYFSRDGEKPFITSIFFDNEQNDQITSIRRDFSYSRQTLVDISGDCDFHMDYNGNSDLTQLRYYCKKYILWDMNMIINIILKPLKRMIK